MPNEPADLPATPQQPRKRRRLPWETSAEQPKRADHGTAEDRGGGQTSLDQPATRRDIEEVISRLEQISERLSVLEGGMRAADKGAILREGARAGTSGGDRQASAADAPPRQPGDRPEVGPGLGTASSARPKLSFFDRQENARRVEFDSGSSGDEDGANDRRRPAREAVHRQTSAR